MAMLAHAGRMMSVKYRLFYDVGHFIYPESRHHIKDVPYLLCERINGCRIRAIRFVLFLLSIREDLIAGACVCAFVGV